MSDIFVSYARQDADRIRPLIEELEAQGWSVFWDREVPVGTSWEEYIGRKLEQAGCVVVAWSEAAITSDYVKEEARIGKGRKILVPVLLEPVEPPFGHGGLQAANLSQWDGAPGAPELGALLKGLRRVLGAPPGGAAGQRDRAPGAAERAVAPEVSAPSRRETAAPRAEGRSAMPRAWLRSHLWEAGAVAAGILALVIWIGMRGGDDEQAPGPLDAALAQLETVERVAEAWDPLWAESSLAARLAPAVAHLEIPGSIAFRCSTCETQPGQPLRPPGSPGGLDNAGMETARTTSGLILRFDNAWSPLPLPPALLALVSDSRVTDPEDRSGPGWSRMLPPPRLDPQFLQPNPMVYDIEVEPLAIKPPETLAEFERLWETLRGIELDICVPRELPSRWVGLESPLHSFEMNYTVEETEASWPVVPTRLEPLGSEARGFWVDYFEHEFQPTHHYVGFTRWGTVGAAVKCKRTVFGLHGAFQNFYGVDWQNSSFARLFPELTGAAIDNAELTFDKLRAVLEVAR